MLGSFQTADTIMFVVLATCWGLAIWNVSRGGSPWLTLAFYVAPVAIMMTIIWYLRAGSLFSNIFADRPHWNPVFRALVILVFGLYAHMIPVILRLFLVLLRFLKGKTLRKIQPIERYLYFGLTAFSYLIFTLTVLVNRPLT